VPPPAPAAAPEPAAPPPPPPPPTRRNPAPIAWLEPATSPSPTDLGIVVDLSRVGTPAELWEAAAAALAKARGKDGGGGGQPAPALLSLPPRPCRVRVVYQDSSGDLLVLAPGEPWGRLVSSARRVILSSAPA